MRVRWSTSLRLLLHHMHVCEQKHQPHPCLNKPLCCTQDRTGNRTNVTRQNSAENKTRHNLLCEVVENVAETWREQYRRDNWRDGEQDRGQLSHWLSRFVVEVRKVDGTDYPPDSIHHIIAGLQRLEGRHVNLFTVLSFWCCLSM